MPSKPRSDQPPEEPRPGEPVGGTQDTEPERAVDPPQATPDDVTDKERVASEGWVQIDSSAMLTLPSGASYAFNAGEVRQLSAEDANFVIDQGYGSKVDDQSEE
jgi:hypothetical protein